MYFAFDRDNGAIWRPDGEAEPAWSVMPNFAIRRKRRAPKPPREPAPPVDPAIAYLKQREAKLAERVQGEQRRTGLERPHGMAVLELERVREQLNAHGNAHGCAGSGRDGGGGKGIATQPAEIARV